MKRWLKRWGIWVAAVVVLVSVGILALKQWSSGSADGTVRVGNPSGQEEAAPKPLAVKTQYFTTTLPGGFNLKRQTETPEAASTHLQLVAVAGGGADQQFAVTMGAMPAAGLHDVADYRLRTTNPDSYAPLAFAGLPEGAAAFRTASNPASFVVFSAHGSQYSEVALSTDGGASYAQMEATYLQALGAWQWQ